MANDDHAIVVGVSYYPALGDLDGPENDARDFASWLESRTGGQVPEEQVVTILSSCYRRPARPNRAEPTTEALRNAIDDLVELGDTTGRIGRRLYLFLAGHGFAPDLEETALLMANAARGRTGHHVPGRRYADWFRKSPYFDEVVLFMDCCRENYPRRPLQAVHLDDIAGTQPARFFYGLATEFSRAARERPDQRGVVHGVFTRALLNGLATPPAGGQAITGSWLERFVYNELTTALPDQERQEPKFSYDRMNEIVFAGANPVYQAPFRIRITAGAAGPDPELQDGSFTQVASVSRAGRIWEWALGPGLYRYGPRGGPYRTLELVGEGRVVDVDI
ncbi:Caspase domain-containing protein [Geodermatophilus amargosae]|uniref:Caspase domain-containing protein n=1 Tax=Geodermatophilus amargosae TaxID=1296565 RepID=A0A1I7CGK8_9ACTN|nr:caspase family protein [Geodermatophilus amargosae]SFT98556.1 Caspase domain-containing protein [Geodermatophilus amargosae]